MTKSKICKKCKSENLISDEEILTYCDDCGHIQNQKKAKIEFEKEMGEY